LKELLRLKIKDYPETKGNAILQKMASVFEKEELRELCRSHVPTADLESFSSQEQHPSETTLVSTVEESSHDNHQSPSPALEPTVAVFRCPVEKVSTAQLKKLLLLLVTELPPPASEILRRGIASSVERSELEALCQHHCSEEDFGRLSSSLFPPPSPPTTASPSEPSPLRPLMTKKSTSVAQEDSEEEEDDEDSGDEASSAPRHATRKLVFRSILTLTALDDGNCLRGMLFKRSRRSLFQSWNERFWILSYSLLSLRYFKISR
jgi:hypothetical protein